MKEKGIKSYIKLQDHEKRKTRAYRAGIGKYYNMTCAVFEDENYYICHDRRELRHMRTESRVQDGIHRPLRYMAVQTAAAANTERNVCTDMMLKRIQSGTRS